MIVYIHCSDSKFGNAAMIDGWHSKRGFGNKYGVHIGYHIVILNGQLTSDTYNERWDGHVETGRAFDKDDVISESEQGAHVYGNNEDTLAICLIGETDNFTSKQLNRLMMEIRILRNEKGKFITKQHSDSDPKKSYCAGLSDYVMKVLNEISQK